MHVLCGGESRHLDAIGPGGSTQSLYQQMASNMGGGGSGGGGRGGGGSGGGAGRGSGGGAGGGSGGSTSLSSRGCAGGAGGASFEALSGLGHFGPLEAPDAFAARVWEACTQSARQQQNVLPARSRL